jgi:hypothetical protein
MCLSSDTYSKKIQIKECTHTSKYSQVFTYWMKHENQTKRNPTHLFIQSVTQVHPNCPPDCELATQVRHKWTPNDELLQLNALAPLKIWQSITHLTTNSFPHYWVSHTVHHKSLKFLHGYIKEVYFPWPNFIVNHINHPPQFIGPITSTLGGSHPVTSHQIFSRGWHLKVGKGPCREAGF